MHNNFLDSGLQLGNLRNLAQILSQAAQPGLKKLLSWKEDSKKPLIPEK
jgi:hypothetical protein